MSNLYYTPSQGQLASWLVANSCADKAFFCNSGAEANEAAIKCARKHANDRGITDPVIITAKQSFHGRTLAAISATGQPKYHKGFTYGGEMVKGFQYVEYNNLEELQAMVDEMNVTPEEDAKAGRSVACLFLFVCHVEMMHRVHFVLMGNAVQQMPITSLAYAHGNNFNMFGK